MSSGTFWFIMARAIMAFGGAAEYGACMLTGCPHGPTTPGTVGAQVP
jgi:hypothetical protein